MTTASWSKGLPSPVQKGRLLIYKQKRLGLMGPNKKGQFHIFTPGRESKSYYITRE